MIQTQSISLEREAPRSRRRSLHVPDLGRAIELSIDVNADVRRIFQALTVPEYLETWMCVPGSEAGSTLVASKEDNGFCLEHFSADRMAFKIMGSYLFCHQHKMRWSWRKTWRETWSESKVDFRLRGNFGSSILELRHLALRSADEYFWHQRFWLGSLAKLASLLRST